MPARTAWGGDEAVDQLADGSAAVSKSFCCVSMLLARASRPRPLQVPLVAGAGEHFHPNRRAGGDVTIKQPVNPFADRAACVTEELDPGRRVDENHPDRPARSSPRSPSHPEPRIRCASASSKASAATVRSAKLTASRFVRRP